MPQTSHLQVVHARSWWLFYKVRSLLFTKKNNSETLSHFHETIQTKLNPLSSLCIKDLPLLWFSIVLWCSSLMEVILIYFSLPLPFPCCICAKSKVCVCREITCVAFCSLALFLWAEKMWHIGIGNVHLLPSFPLKISIHFDLFVVIRGCSIDTCTSRNSLYKNCFYFDLIKISHSNFCHYFSLKLVVLKCLKGLFPPRHCRNKAIMAHCIASMI